jgi:hypothetical protein
MKKGKPYPLGATLTDGGVNFSIFSAHAKAMHLLLFGNQDAIAANRVISLDPTLNRTGDYWHIEIPGIVPAQVYAYRADGTDTAPPERRTSMSMNGSIGDPYPAGMEKNRGASRRFLAAGILLLILAMVCMALTVPVSSTLVLVFGLLLLTGGILSLAQAFFTESLDEFVSPLPERPVATGLWPSAHPVSMSARDGVDDDCAIHRRIGPRCALQPGDIPALSMGAARPAARSGARVLDAYRCPKLPLTADDREWLRSIDRAFRDDQDR